MSHNIPSANAHMDWSNNSASDNARLHLGNNYNCNSNAFPYQVVVSLD